MNETAVKAKFDYKGKIYTGVYKKEALIFMITDKESGSNTLVFRFNGKTIDEAIENGIKQGYKISK